MWSLIAVYLALSITGCNSWPLNSDLDKVYCAYDKDDCTQMMLGLSQAERWIHARPYLQPEISLLRDQCLERQSLLVDVAQTYHFIIAHYPTSEYTYRVRAWLETLHQPGRLSETPASASAVPTRLQTAGGLNGRLG